MAAPGRVSNSPSRTTDARTTGASKQERRRAWQGWKCLEVRVADSQDWVYVVDDDLSVREALSSLIRSVGLQVETYASAAAFL